MLRCQRRLQWTNNKIQFVLHSLKILKFEKERKNSSIVIKAGGDNGGKKRDDGIHNMNNLKFSWKWQISILNILTTLAICLVKKKSLSKITSMLRGEFASMLCVEFRTMLCGEFIIMLCGDPGEV